ncbi:glycosyltransferase [Candidatus Bipolaricaulota bacterium]
MVAQFPSPIFPLVVRAARQLGTPYILYVMGDIREVVATSGKYPWLIRRLFVEPIAAMMHWLALRASDGAMVIAASQSIAKQYASASSHSFVFAPSSISGNEIVDRQDTCRTTPIRLLFVGRLVPVKGLAYLIEALALLVDDGLPVHLELVGAGPQRRALESLTAERGIASVVEFSGEIPFGSDLLAHYRMADIFVLPSLSEGTPRVLWEAMASGVPIVAACVGGIPDLISHGETGLLVNPRAPGQLAESIRRLIEDKELRKRLIQSGYSLVEKHTVEKQASTLWEHITAFLEASPE